MLPSLVCEASTIRRRICKRWVAVASIETIRCFNLRTARDAMGVGAHSDGGKRDCAKSSCHLFVEEENRLRRTHSKEWKSSACGAP